MRKDDSTMRSVVSVAMSAQSVCATRNYQFYIMLRVLNTPVSGLPPTTFRFASRGAIVLCACYAR